MADYIYRDDALGVIDEAVRDWKPGIGIGKMEYIRIRMKNLPAAYPVCCGSCEYGRDIGLEYICKKHSGHKEKFGEDVTYTEYHPGCYFCGDGRLKE